MRRLAVLVVLVVGVAAAGSLSSAPAAEAQTAESLCDVGQVEQFTDVAAADYAAAYVLCMRALGLSVGTGGGSYGPDRELNRGQMATFLVRLWRDVLGNECPSGVVTPFIDIDAGSTHAANIDCLYGLELTTGTGADTYGPRDPLKASQISRFLYRTYRKAGGDMCAGTDGPELARATECLLRLRVVPTSGEATATTVVIRAQMGVYMVGLWHNLSGRGLPPPPPLLGAATPTQPTTAPPTTTTPDANVTGPGQPDPTMCRPMGSSGITAGFPLPSWAMPSVGSIQVAVLFVDFPDIPATRSPDDEAEIFLPFAEEYLESVSYGKLDLEFVLLRRWLRVENNHDFYLTEGRLGIGRAINGEAARLADPEFDFTGYEGIMIVMPGSHFTGGNALGSSDTDEGTITTVRMNTFVSEAFWEQGRVAAHELAHHFGLLDFYPYDFSLHQLRSAPEGKAWVHTRIGLMSLQVNFLTHPQDSRLAFESRFSDGSTFTNYSAFFEAFEMLAWSRWQLGWLDQTQIRCVTESETTVSLSPVADPTDGIVMVAVPLSQTELIVMESRRKIGYDATRETQEGNGYVVDIPALPTEGVLVYTVNAALGTGQLPVKVAGDTGNGQVDFFPLLTDGQSVTIRGYTITVKSSTSTTHTVTITKAPS